MVIYVNHFFYEEISTKYNFLVLIIRSSSNNMFINYVNILRISIFSHIILFFQLESFIYRFGMNKIKVRNCSEGIGLGSLCYFLNIRRFADNHTEQMFAPKCRKSGSLFGGSESKTGEDSGSEPKKRFACPPLVISNCLKSISPE